MRRCSEQHIVLVPNLLAPASVARLSDPTLCITSNSNDLHRQDSRHIGGCLYTICFGLAEVAAHNIRVSFGGYTVAFTIEVNRKKQICETRWKEQTLRRK